MSLALILLQEGHPASKYLHHSKEDSTRTKQQEKNRNCRDTESIETHKR